MAIARLRQCADAIARVIDTDYQASGVALPSLIEAQTDREALVHWLNGYLSKKNTYDACKKEGFRFILWLETKGLRLSELNLTHVRAYIKHLGNPLPRSEWVGKPIRMRMPDGSLNPKWRPMSGPLHGNSLHYAIARVSAFVEFLFRAKYVSGNPFKLLTGTERRAGLVISDRENKVSQMVLDDHAKDVLFDYLRSMEDGPERQKRIIARARWIIVFMLSTGARRSEVANAKMKDIQKLHNSWVWHVVGKRNKEAYLPVSRELMLELRRYRVHLGLSPLPQPDEEGALVRNLWGSEETLTSSSIYQTFTGILKSAAKARELAGDEEGARVLRQCSPHWLRHTYVTKLLRNGFSLVETRDMARHENIATVSIYSHSEFKNLQEKISDMEFT